MASDKKGNKNKVLPAGEQEDEGGESGTSGQGGKIEFVDFLATGASLRDDLLPFEEKKRLLYVHKETHELKVKQQKEKRQQYKDLKEGKIPLQTFREGLSAAGITSQYKANPILANKAQFSGIDRQVTALPNENVADTNNDQRNELQNELKLRLGLQPAPAFNPKPRLPGM